MEECPTEDDGITAVIDLNDSEVLGSNLITRLADMLMVRDEHLSLVVISTNNNTWLVPYYDSMNHLPDLACSSGNESFSTQQRPYNSIRVLKVDSCGIGDHIEVFVEQCIDHLGSLEMLSLANNHIERFTGNLTEINSIKTIHTGIEKLLSSCPIRLLDISGNLIQDLEITNACETKIKVEPI